MSGPPEHDQLPEVLVVDGWPGVRSYLPGRSGWFGYSSNSRTVFHRSTAAYRDGEQYVEVATHRVSAPTPDRLGEFITDGLLAHQLFDRFVAERVAAPNTRYPMPLTLDRLDTAIIVDDDPVAFVGFTAGKLWVAGAQLPSRAVVVLAFDHLVDRVSLRTVPANEVAAD